MRAARSSARVGAGVGARSEEEEIETRQDEKRRGERERESKKRVSVGGPRRPQKCMDMKGAAAPLVILIQ